MDDDDDDDKIRYEPVELFFVSVDPDPPLVVLGFRAHFLQHPD